MTEMQIYTVEIPTDTAHFMDWFSDYALHLPGLVGEVGIDPDSGNSVYIFCDNPEAARSRWLKLAGKTHFEIHGSYIVTVPQTPGTPTHKGWEQRFVRGIVWLSALSLSSQRTIIEIRPRPGYETFGHRVYDDLRVAYMLTPLAEASARLNAESVDVAILTVLPDEYEAVCEQFAQLRPPSGTGSAANVYAWQVGEVPCARLGGSYIVAVGMMGRAGTPLSALATVDAIQRWKPRYVFFVGIAGGISGLDKGDVVIADVIYGYEYGKLEDAFQPRDNWTYKTDLGLLNGATAFARLSTWQERITTQPPNECTPKVVTCEVASGDKVVDDPSNEFFQAVLTRWKKVKAVEMEGAGAGAAIEQVQALGIPVGYMMIRGISDIPRPDQADELRGTVERDTWKVYATRTAAAFTLGHIAHGLPEPPR